MKKATSIGDRMKNAANSHTRHTTEVIVKQDDKKPVAVEVMAEAIVAISQGVKRLLAGPLNEKALLLLIQHAAPGYRQGYGTKKCGQVEIRCVLDGIQSLEAVYLKKKPK